VVGTHLPASSENPLGPALDGLLEAGTAELAVFTEEELQAVGAITSAAFPETAPPQRLRSLPEPTRQAVLATALRSLIARGMVLPPTDAQLKAAGETAPVELETRDELKVVLRVRADPAMVAFVGQRETFSVLHGVRGSRPPAFLQEDVSPQGLHAFTLRSLEAMVEALAGQVDSGDVTASGAPAEGLPQAEAADDVVEALRGFADGTLRIDAYHQRPAGNRRLQLGVLVRPEATWVLASAFGVEPRPPRARRVSREGLRWCLESLLVDAGEPD
jgi:hypothetical protein